MVQPAARVDLEQARIPDGDATFKVEVTNSVGFTFSKEVVFTVDLTDPLVGIPTPIELDTSNRDNLQGQYFDEQRGMLCTPTQPPDPNDTCLLYARRAFDIANQVSDDRGLDSVTIAVDGEVVARPQIGPTTVSTGPLTIDPAFLPSATRDGRKTIAVEAIDKARNVVLDSRQVVFDTNPPILSSITISPADGSNSGFILDRIPKLARGTVDISSQVQDNLGFSSASLQFDGAPIVREVANQDRDITLTAASIGTADFPDGLHAFSVAAIDRAGNQLPVSGTSRNELLVEFDNTAPVLSLDTFRLVDRTTCSMGGSVADNHFQSLVFSTSSGFRRDLLTGDDAGPFTIEFGFDQRDFTLEARDDVGNVAVLNGRYEFSFTVSGSGQSGPALITTTCSIFVEGRRVFRRSVNS
jgi:hypothetical protein